MIEITLTAGKVALIDECDLPVVQQYSWYYLWTRNKEYAATKLNGKTTYMHRLILEGDEIDHIDGNGLNNQRSNLRSATHQQNLANQKLSAASTTGFKGVTKDKRLKAKWMAQTKYNGQRVYIGKFNSPEEAACAYDEKMVELHGEFAKTNKALGLL